MNRLHLLVSLLVAMVFLPACNNSTTISNANSMVASMDNPRSTSEENIKRPIKYFPTMDPRFNIPSGYMPLPTDWNLSKKNSENIFLESAAGVKVFLANGNNFFYSNDQWMNQSMQQSGMQVQQPRSAEQLVKQDLIPYAKSEGITLIKQYEMPQVAQFYSNLDKLFFKSVPVQKQYRTVVTEWTDNKDISSLLIMTHNIAHSQYASNWGYVIENMEAPTAQFNDAKRAYLNGIINMQINPKWVQLCNQQAQQASQQSAANHQARMGALRAQGDQIIAAGKSHDASTTRSHQKFIDYINDEVTVANPSTGQMYKVATGNNHYWINDNNQLLTSDNANYNPNGGGNTTETWTEAQIQN